MKTKVKWIGKIPSYCNLCGNKLDKGSSEVFYDARIKSSQGRSLWLILCHNCFMRSGGELGTGKGQQFDLKTGVKIAG